MHAGLGDADAVFDWLERAYAARDVHLMFLTVDLKWDPYRSDPRFGDLLARCGFTDDRHASRQGRSSAERAPGPFAALVLFDVDSHVLEEMHALA